MSDFAWANRDFLTISAVFQAIDLWAYATNEKYNWKTRGGSRKNIFVPFAPTGGNVLQYKASYRIFNLESVKHCFSLQCRWYAHVDCGFLSLSWNSISTACTAAQLKNPAHVDVAVAPKVAPFTSVHFKEPQIDATKSTWREPLMFLLEFPLLELKQLWKNWTKDEKMSISVDLAVFRVGPWDVVQNCVEACWCLIFCMPRDWSIMVNYTTGIIQ